MLIAGRDPGRWLPMSERATEPELLDGGRLEEDELRANLADLARLNRLPGGRAASVAAVAALVRGIAEPIVLDVGTGAADMPLAFAARGWRVVALDADAAVADVARERSASADGITIVAGDARALPLGDGSVDVAHASLLAHHLDPPDAVRAFAEMARVARRGVVINDLRRGLLPLMATAVAVTAFGRCRTTRHDGLLSVRRAYTPRELDDLLDAAGLGVIHRTPAWMPRVVTTAVPRGTR